jgi:hypothetical protein
LVSRGFFPCAPIAPTLAVDIRILQLVKELFVRLAPNISGWCDAFEALLDGMGYRVSAKAIFYFILSISSADGSSGRNSPPI